MEGNQEQMDGENEFLHMDAETEQRALERGIALIAERRAENERQKQARLEQEPRVAPRVGKATSSALGGMQGAFWDELRRRKAEFDNHVCEFCKGGVLLASGYTVAQVEKMPPWDVLEMNILCDCLHGATLRTRIESDSETQREIYVTLEQKYEYKERIKWEKRIAESGIRPNHTKYAIQSFLAHADGDPLLVKAAKLAQDYRDAGMLIPKLHGVSELKHSILFYGETGRGKTVLAASIFRDRVIDSGMATGRWIDVPEFALQVKTAFDGGERQRQLGDRIERAKTVDILVLDEIGLPSSDAYSTYTKDALAMLIRHRCEDELQTIITTQLTPDALGAQLGGAGMARRLREMAQFVWLGGGQR